MTMTVVRDWVKQFIGVQYPTRFTFNTGTLTWTSDDGNYTVWIQGRPLDGTKEWAAQFQQEEWITAFAVDRIDAIKTCQEHYEKMKNEGVFV